MPRLDIDKQKRLEPHRMKYAKDQLESLGYKVQIYENSRIEFEYKDNTIKLFPYSGWHSGKGIVDGRGIQKLINQLKSS